MSSFTKCLIIAEAGVNHNGSLELAKEMAKAAKDAGADIVKYQTAVPELVISRYAQKAEYQKALTGDNESQLDMVRRLHFGFDAHRELAAYCAKIGIEYLSAPFDIPSAEFLSGIGMRYIKLPSGELTNLPLLEKIASFKMPTFMSTGMCELDEIRAALSVLRTGGCTDVTLMHCNTQYPTPDADANLRAMLELKRVFNLAVGYSDHTLGIEADIAAVALGADVIEKHFTLDKSMDGPDHKASLDVRELAAMVSAVHRTQRMLGDGTKHVSDSERPNIAIARKSIVAARSIAKGEELTADNLTTKRPATGVSPMLWHEVLGIKARRDYMEDEPIEL